MHPDMIPGPLKVCNMIAQTFYQPSNWLLFYVPFYVPFGVKVTVKVVLGPLGTSLRLQEAGSGHRPPKPAPLLYTVTHASPQNKLLLHVLHQLLISCEGLCSHPMQSSRGKLPS